MSTWMSMLVLGIIVRHVYSVTQPRLTIITLHESEQVSWDVAYNTCRSLNQSLLTMKSPEKKALIAEMDQKHFNNHIYDSQYWIGLHAPQPGSADCSNAAYYWVDDNSPLGWGEYFNGEPNKCDEELCMRIVNLLLRTRACDRLYFFICEEVLDDCTFETYENSTFTPEQLSQVPSAVITLETNSKKVSCLETCLNTAVDGAFCQAVSINVTSCECVLMFSNYTGFGNLGMVTESHHVTYVKQCFQVLEQPASRVPYEDVCFSQSTTCPTLDPLINLDLTTSSSSVTTTSTSGPDTTTSSDVSTSATTVLDAIYTATTTQNVASTIHPPQPSSGSILASAINRNTCAINISWELPPNADIGKIMKKVHELKQELETLKNSTILYKRAKMSWYDDRVSSKSLGGLGASFLVIFCLLFVVADIISLKTQTKAMTDFS